MKKIVGLVIFMILIFSCAEKKSETQTANDVEEVTLAANLKSMEVDIEGMTCEIGCARLIQSKLSKVDGVTYTKVSFASKKGQFTYDANKISAEDLIAKVNGVAGGDLYNVVNSRELEEILVAKENAE